ncbi:NAD-dependent epimerase/dehydratase family protein [Bifidobacterium dentium]|uniref:NAD-dependent epimerase/dehydratase family protein n=1 Tax=Bifidobacterium dentium TaxID=1689 RepID=UPI0026DB1707|nr:NAD-dependent epimerase/dehydratase family protein [Bifidobacterium dentium]
MSTIQSQVLVNDFETVDEDLFSFAENKTIVISGATGFIGSLLSRFFIWANETYDLGVKLILVARNLDKLKSILPDVAQRDDIDIVRRDFSQPCEPLHIKFDYLVHTAAITTSKTMIDYPINVLDVSYYGAKWALESARMSCNSKVLYLSSMEANGHFSVSTVATEDTLGTVDLASVRSCYPEGKRICELMCRAYSEQLGIHAVVGRLAQTFGAGILPSEGRVFKQFAMSAINDQPIILHTDGSSEGNYVYSIDALRAVFVLLTKGKDGETYNIANEECHMTIRDMAQMVVDNFGGKNTRLIVESNDAVGYGYAAPTKMLLSAAKLRALGWKPVVNLFEAYEVLLKYLKEQTLTERS